MDRRFLEYLLQFITPHKRALFERNLRQRTRHLTVVLEDIYHSHNASACLRSCDAFGVQDVHIIENRYKYKLNPDIDLGSAKWLTLHRYSAGEDNTPECLAKLRDRGYRIVATSPHAESVAVEDLDVSRPTALLFGTEDEGLTETAIELADETVSIPTYGFAESLNISVAVAVTLHHLSHKLRTSDVSWHLRDAEMEAVRLQWVRRAIPNHRRPVIEAAYENRGDAVSQGGDNTAM